MYNIGAFIAGAFFLYVGRNMWKETRLEHELDIHAVNQMPFWANKPMAIIAILLGAFLIFLSIIVTIK